MTKPLSAFLFFLLFEGQVRAGFLLRPVKGPGTQQSDAMCRQTAGPGQACPLPRQGCTLHFSGGCSAYTSLLWTVRLISSYLKLLAADPLHMVDSLVGCQNKALRSMQVPCILIVWAALCLLAIQEDKRMVRLQEGTVRWSRDAVENLLLPQELPWRPPSHNWIPGGQNRGTQSTILLLWDCTGHLQVGGEGRDGDLRS